MPTTSKTNGNDSFKGGCELKLDKWKR